jgi:lipopolysaccharide biosynthesis glycosyltransferase
MLQCFVGFDGKVEPVAYAVFVQSVIENSTIPVTFCPLALNTLHDYKETHTDGSNSFIYSRFLVPHLCNYKGYALFADGDMLCKADVAELLKLAESDPEKAVWVVKHNYKTKHQVKYLGAKNDDYPRKNWSSVVLWNCHHWQNQKLSPQVVMESTGSYLHRFSWLEDRFIGELPTEWNWLETEYVYNRDAKLVHHTLGTPCFKDYQSSPYSTDWWATYNRMIYPLTGNNRESEL